MDFLLSILVTQTGHVLLISLITNGTDDFVHIQYMSVYAVHDD